MKTWNELKSLINHMTDMELGLLLDLVNSEDKMRYMLKDTVKEMCKGGDWTVG